MCFQNIKFNKCHPSSSSKCTKAMSSSLKIIPPTTPVVLTYYTLPKTENNKVWKQNRNKIKKLNNNGLQTDDDSWAILLQIVLHKFTNPKFRNQCYNVFDHVIHCVLLHSPLGLSDFGLLSPTPSNCPFSHYTY